MRSQNPPSMVTYFLQRGHTHFNNVIPPNSAPPLVIIFFQTTTGTLPRFWSVGLRWEALWSGGRLQGQDNMRMSHFNNPGRNLMRLLFMWGFHVRTKTDMPSYLFKAVRDSVCVIWAGCKLLIFIFCSLHILYYLHHTCAEICILDSNTQLKQTNTHTSLPCPMYYVLCSYKARRAFYSGKVNSLKKSL